MRSPIDAGLATLYVGDNRNPIAANSGTLNSADGRIDELRLHDVAQTAAEIATDMNSARACDPSAPNHL